MRIFPWKSLLFTSFTAVSNIKLFREISRRKFKGNRTKNRVICQEISHFHYLCTVNVNIELLENFGVILGIVLENSLNFTYQSPKRTLIIP